MFKPLYKPNQLICGTGKTVVVTGWTVKESIAKALQSSEYAAIGQLYSPTRGIDFLIRNLLNNPHVADLILLAATREDQAPQGSQCLYDFFNYGVTRGVSDRGIDCWIIDSPTTGYIDVEIPLASLELLRSKVKAHLFTDKTAALDYIHFLAAEFVTSSLDPWGEPQIFPKNEPPASELKPGQRFGNTIYASTIPEAWVEVLYRIRSTGIEQPHGYDGKRQELINTQIVIEAEPEALTLPEPNYLPCDAAAIADYLDYMVKDAPKIEGVKYTYGSRMRSWFGMDQVQTVIQKIAKEIDCPSGIINLWDVNDHIKGGSPCLNHINVRVLDGKTLTLTAIFRSHDMFGAYPSNAYGLRALQQHIQSELAKLGIELEMGRLITISQSCHIYDDCYNYADSVVKEQRSKLLNRQRKTYFDPCGNFLIEVNNGEIVVTQMTPGNGEPVHCYQSSNTLELIRTIAEQNPGIQPSHVGYLGIEIERAKIAIELGAEYRQDQKLPAWRKANADD